MAREIATRNDIEVRKSALQRIIGRVPGPLIKLLTEAYSDLVDFDFVEQYLQHLR